MWYISDIFHETEMVWYATVSLKVLNMNPNGV